MIFLERFEQSGKLKLTIMMSGDYVEANSLLQDLN